ncbi:MAG: hypothetical protein NTY01_01995 [Verrucomicrobia bacterium]|nr:hypothetical protein [Verrucomicrobiota bacterium]
MCVVIAMAIAARGWLLFGTPLVPGMNGGYYLVQARALLSAGALGIPDLPLTFVLQAALAKVIEWLTSHDIESSIVLAVKLADAALPPLAALPVFLLGRAWSERAGRGAWLSVAAAAVVALGVPALSMVGDFQKNSLGLLWLAGLICALFAWKRHRSIACGVAVLLLLGLTGLTHIAVFGSALLLTATVFAAGVVLPRSEAGGARVRVAWPLVAAGLGVAALAAGLVLWKFDPARIHRLVGAFSNPTSFLRGKGPPMRPPTGGPAVGFSKGGPPPIGDPMLGPPPPGDDPMGGPPPLFGGFMGGSMRGPGPGPMMFPRWMLAAAFGGVSLCALALAWWRRRALPPAESVIGIGCAATTLLLTGPWVQGDVAGRFYLDAMIPATVAGLFVLFQIPNVWARLLLGSVIVLPAVGLAVPLVARGGHPIISEAAFRELQTLASRVAHPERTLVVTRHGVEWWTAWTLHTRVAQAKAVRADDWQKYGEVLFLQSKERGPGFGPPGRGLGRGPRPFAGFPGGAARGGFRDGPPPGFPPFGKGPRGFPGRGNMPPMMDAEIPDDAKILHDGRFFKLAKVAKPPAFVHQNKPGDADADRP